MWTPDPYCISFLSVTCGNLDFSQLLSSPLAICFIYYRTTKCVFLLALLRLLRCNGTGQTHRRNHGWVNLYTLDMIKKIKTVRIYTSILRRAKIWQKFQSRIRSLKIKASVKTTYALAANCVSRWSPNYGRGRFTFWTLILLPPIKGNTVFLINLHLRHNVEIAILFKRPSWKWQPCFILRMGTNVRMQQVFRVP